MPHQRAIDIAIALLHLPARVREHRSEGLPPDVGQLLQIVAGEPAALELAQRQTGQPDNVLRNASAFYVEQILLHPDADAYRVLGCQMNAPVEDLRRHMALLLRWLHPDHESNQSRAIFAGRVTSAWNALKIEAHRAAYDRKLIMRAAPKAPPKRSARAKVVSAVADGAGGYRRVNRVGRDGSTRLPVTSRKSVNGQPKLRWLFLRRLLNLLRRPH